MSGYVEVMVRGNSRAFLAAGQIAGILTAAGSTANTVATPEEPFAILMNSGETLHGVYGISPNRLMLYVEGVKAILRKTGRIVVVAYLDKQSEFEAQIAELFAGMDHGEAG